MNSDESFLKKLDTDLSTGNAVIDNRRGILHQVREKPVVDNWQKDVQDFPVEEDPYEKIMKKRMQQQTFFKKMFITACVFALIAGGVFIYSLFNGKAQLSGENVQVTVLAKTFADSGEEVSVRVTVINENPVPMEKARLILKYPLGTARDPQATRDIERDLGTVNPGEIRDETFSVELFGEQGTEKQLTALVEYQLQDSNATFEKIGQSSLTLRSSVASIVVTGPESILSGQIVPLRLVLSGNSSAVVQNTLLVTNYADGCIYEQSDTAPTLDKNIWFLGDLQPGTQKEINLTLRCSGIVNTEKLIQFSLGKQSDANERVIESVYTNNRHIVRLNQAFLATTLVIGGKAFDGTVAIQQNRDVPIEINWENTSDVSINNAKIILQLSGNAYDPSRVRAGAGFFDSNNNTVVWTQNEIPQLQSIQPGQKGQFGITLASRPGLNSLATLDLAVSLEGILFGGKVERVVDAISVKVPVTTDVQLIPRVLYHSGPLQNSGPIPAKVGSETTYTIIWQIANSTNPVTQTTVRATLPTGIIWKNVVAPVTESGTVTYNTVTREIVWNAGTMPVGQEARSVAFKLGITPTTAMVGTVPNITSDMTLTTTDSVTKTIINQTKRALTTRTTGDTSPVGADGKIVP